jgi:uncharacterized protein (TIGR03435 family)
VFGLVVAKSGLKIKESPKDPEMDASSSGEEPKKAPRPVNVTGSGGRGGVNINLGGGSYFRFGDNKLEARRLTMANLAETLARFSDRPIVDMTDLKGIYDIDLAFTQEDYNAMLIRAALASGANLPPEALKMLEGSSGDSMGAALEKLGLKLENRKAPMDVLVIDKVSRTPTEN